MNTDISILLTAFVPFGGDKINPAQEAVKRVSLPGVTKLYLPVEYEKAARLVSEELDRLKPDLVICVGQAGGRRGITPERTGVNERNALSPDNGGRVCVREKIAPEGPDRLETSFGPDGMAYMLNACGIPAYVSEGAGTYVCNDVLYSLMHRLTGTQIRGGFIHVPFSAEMAPEHPGAFTMELSEIVRALEICCVYAAEQIRLYRRNYA